MNRAVLFKKIAQANAMILENQANISISNNNVQTVEQEQHQNHIQTQAVKISVSHDDSFNLDSGDLCTKIKRNIKPKTIINSGPYNYKMVFENKDYPHSVNLNKLNFTYQIKNEEKNKLLFLSTGHSFAEAQYKTDTNIQIYKTNQIEQIFTNSNSNIFYSLDNGFDDFCLLSFDESLNIEQTNTMSFNGSNHIINSVCRNMDIKFLENEILIKNGHNTGETKTKPLINFETDIYLTSKKNKSTYFTFKINGYIVIISSKFASGIVVKGTTSSISKFNGEPIDDNKINQQLEYYFFNSIKEFKNHELFESIDFEQILADNNKITELKTYYTQYKQTNSLTVVSMMGDSGSGFFRLMSDNNLEFVGINIGGCSMIVLKEDPSIELNSNTIYWDNSREKLVFGKYVIDQVHRACQVLPINQIEELINRNLPTSIRVKEIGV